MKRVKIFFLSVSAAAGMMFAVPARADMFGAGESALLAQQIFQSIQDFGLATGGVMDGTSTFGVVYEMLEQVYDKAGQVYDMASTAAGLTTMFDPEIFIDPTKSLQDAQRLKNAKANVDKFNAGVQNTSDFGRSLSSITRDFVSTSRQLTSYVEYLSQFGDDLSLAHASSIYRTFTSNSASLIYSIGNSILALSRIKGLTPLEFKDKQKELLADIAGKMSSYARNARSEIQADVTEIVRQERARRRSNALRQVYY